MSQSVCLTGTTTGMTASFIIFQRASRDILAIASLEDLLKYLVELEVS